MMFTNIREQAMHTLYIRIWSSIISSQVTGSLTIYELSEDNISAFLPQSLCCSSPASRKRSRESPFRAIRADIDRDNRGRTTSAPRTEAGNTLPRLAARKSIHKRKYSDIRNFDPQSSKYGEFLNLEICILIR